MGRPAAVVVVAALLVLLGCGGEPAPPAVEQPALPDAQEAAPIQLDREAPWSVHFGRGSGWHGLDTVKVAEDGTVTLYRLRSEEKAQNVAHLFFETATLRLPAEALTEVLDAVKRNGLLGLQKQYHKPNIADGTQWVFLFKQGEKEKSVYFNNRFPEEIRRFADTLDGVLNQNGLGKTDWHRVPEADGRKHEKELWDSIKR